MGKPKLLQIGKYYYPEPGGMETHLYDLCNQLKNKYEVHVIVANRRLKTVREKVAGVQVTRVANWGEIFSSPICPTMPFYFRRFEGDRGSIIQLHLPNPMAHMAFKVVQPTGRLIVMWHSDIIRQRWLSKLYNKHLYELLERADCIVATSPNYAKSSPFLRKFADKCVIVPLGIDPEKFSMNAETSHLRKLIRQKYGNRIALFVGRLTYYKGLDYLLEAAKQIQGNVLLIGDGPLKSKIEHQIQSEQLSHKVFLLPGISHQQLASYYHACDVFVLPSNHRSEAFGMVQLEAMVCGKPTVSTNLKTGVPWVNRHGDTGLVVPVNDGGELAEAVNHLFENKNESMRLGENGRRRVLSNFTIEMVAQRMESVYEQVLNGGIEKTHDALMEKDCSI